jgi:hypothetical protein
MFRSLSKLTESRWNQYFENSHNVYSLACGLGSALVEVVAEAWLTTPHALIGCSQAEPS